MENIDKEIVDSFVSEGFERLEEAESKMHLLESDDSRDIVNIIFRLFHSIKGSASYLDFNNIKKVTHEAETLLDIFRKTGKRPSPKDADLLYQTLDLLKQLITSVEKVLTDQGYEEETELVVHSISESIRNIQLESDKPVEKTDDSKTDVNVQKINSIENLITSEMVEKFVDESLQLLDDSEKTTLGLDKNPEDQEKVQQLFRNIHTLKGNAGFFSFSKIEKNSMDLENVLDSIRKGNSKIDNDIITTILRAIDRLRGETAMAYIPGKVMDELKEPETAVMEYKPLGEILVETGQISPEVIDNALKIQQKMAGGENQTRQDFQRKEIRVDMKKLDRLFDMVGELITAETIVVNNRDFEGQNLQNFEKSANTLGKICREIQEITMMIRMIPLEGLFTKMNRLVRDLSRKSGKNTLLHISGEDTEMDRNVIEQISDPLVHIIRNSIDHGIETIEGRKSAGKAPDGNIYLNARYEGNEIWLIVQDDGTGLDREKILKKAAETGLFTGDSGNLSDKEVWQFIFEPGFSTSEKVTEISGRGVGMDVVKKNMEKLRGKAEIDSEPGKGTQITLKIPLTMAILDGITVQVENNFYSIPSTDIVEFVNIEDKMLISTGKNVMLNLRGEILPVIRFRDTFRFAGSESADMKRLAIVVQGGGNKACLLIDSIIGSQQIVIKSISDYLGSIDGISGCSILGNGNVSFLIDTARLIGRCIGE